MRFTQITFRQMAYSQIAGARIRALANALEERHLEILRCRVTVERVPVQKKGQAYVVTVELRLAEGEIVSGAEGTNVEEAARAVFADLARKLAERNSRVRAA